MLATDDDHYKSLEDKHYDFFELANLAGFATNLICFKETSIQGLLWNMI